MFLYAGLLYIIPDSLKAEMGALGQSRPADVIRDAIIGLILLFAAYLILNTINPDLVTPQTAPRTPASSTSGTTTGTLGLTPTPAPTFTPGGGSFGGAGSTKGF